MPYWYENFVLAKLIGGVTPYQISQEPYIWRKRTLHAELALHNAKKQKG